MHHYCTLFDSNSIVQGLALYQSLKKKAGFNFHLYIFALDDLCFDFLEEEQLENCTIISLKNFETPELLAVKEGRSKAEYSWTCTPWVILHCIKSYNLEACTYLDADLYFFKDPALLIEEIPATKSVLITEHRFSKAYISAIDAGIYCVQFMTFKNTVKGLEILQYWADLCLDWCFNNIEPTRFGNQKYLDDWTTRFSKEVHVLNHLGGGLAPWNEQQYLFTKDLKGLEFTSKKSFDCVFYHFHNIKIKNRAILFNKYYLISKISYDIIYKEYIQFLNDINDYYNLGFPKLTLFYKDMEKSMKEALSKSKKDLK